MMALPASYGLYPPNSVPAYLYARLIVNSLWTGTLWQCNELFFYDAALNDLCNGGIATSSGTSASNAFDRNTSTFCSSISGTGGWVQYQFPSAKAITNFKASNTAGSTYKYQGSNDGSTWTDLCSVSANTTRTNLANVYQCFGINGVQAWRLKINSVQNNGSEVDISEFEIHTSVGGAQALTGGFPTASSCINSSTSTANAAFDGSNSSQWINQTTNDGVTAGFTWLGYILPYGSLITPVEITIRSSSSGSITAPKAFTLDKSSDGGATWATVQSYNQTSWSNSQTKTFSV